MTDLSQIPTDQLVSMLGQSPQPSTNLSSIPTNQLVSMLQKQSDTTGPAAFSPVADTSGFENTRAGVGSGMVNGWLGAQQMLAHIPNTNPFIPDDIHERVQGDIDQRIADKQQMDRALETTSGGRVGRDIGEAADSLLIPTARVAQLGKWGNAALTGLVQGAGTGAMQPVDVGSAAPNGSEQTPSYWTQKAEDVGASAGMGAGTGGALSATGSLFSRLVSPHNAVGSVMNFLGRKDATSDFAKQGEDLVANGYGLTPAQITGNIAQAKVENAARTSLFGSDAVHTVDDANAQKWVNNVSNLVDGVSSQDSGFSGNAEEAGERLRGTFQQAYDAIKKARDDQAATDFGRVNAMTQGAGQVNTSNTNGLLQNIYDQYSGIGTPGADSIASFAKKQLSNVGADGAASTAPAQGNINKIMQLRSFLSSVSAGKDSISGKPIDKSIAAQMLGSINQDINQSADAIGGDVGGALKTANDNYAAGSQNLESLKQTTVGKLLGENFNIEGMDFNSIDPEKVYQKFQSMNPSQIAMTKQIMKQYNEPAWQDVKATVLHQALSDAQSSAPAAGAKTLPANTGSYVSALEGTKGSNWPRIQAMFDPDEMTDINRTIDAGRRLADRTGSNPSGTTPMAEVYGLFHAVPRALMGDPLAMGQIAGQVAAPKAIANIMANPEGRATVQQLSRLPPGSAQARQLLTRFAAIAGGQSVDAMANQGQ